MAEGKVRKMYDMIPAVKQSMFRDMVVAGKGFSRQAFYLLINRDVENICAEDRRIIVAAFRKVGMNSPFTKRKRKNAKSTNKKTVRSRRNDGVDREV